jgi:uncharacterized membrane protein
VIVHWGGIALEEIEDLVKELPNKKQAVFRSIFASIVLESNWKSFIPPPAILKSYNEVFEDGAQKIFLEFKKELDHRIDMDKVIIPKQLSQSRSGQIYGLVIALSFLVVSSILVLMGHGLYGTIIGGSNIVTLVTIFVLNKRQIEKLGE